MPIFIVGRRRRCPASLLLLLLLFLMMMMAAAAPSGGGGTTTEEIVDELLRMRTALNASLAAQERAEQYRAYAAEQPSSYSGVLLQHSRDQAVMAAERQRRRAAVRTQLASIVQSITHIIERTADPQVRRSVGRSVGRTIELMIVRHFVANWWPLLQKMVVAPVCTNLLQLGPVKDLCDKRQTTGYRLALAVCLPIPMKVQKFVVCLHVSVVCRRNLPFVFR